MTLHELAVRFVYFDAGFLFYALILRMEQTHRSKTQTEENGFQPLNKRKRKYISLMGLLFIAPIAYGTLLK